MEYLFCVLIMVFILIPAILLFIFMLFAEGFFPFADRIMSKKLIKKVKKKNYVFTIGSELYETKKLEVFDYIYEKNKLLGVAYLKEGDNRRLIYCYVSSILSNKNNSRLICKSWVANWIMSSNLSNGHKKKKIKQLKKLGEKK